MSSYRHAWGRRINYRPDLQQDPRRKRPQTKERHVHTDTRSTQHIQKTWSERKVPTEKELSWYIIVKTLNTHSKERVLTPAREKHNIKGNPRGKEMIFSMETLKVRISWRNAFPVLKNYNVQPRLIYPAKLSTKGEGNKNLALSKQTLKIYNQ